MTDDFPSDANKRTALKIEPAPIERFANGRFKPGNSANPSGRPRKRERSFIPRQLTRDILSITEELITVNTAEGPKIYTAIQLALLKMRKKALEGHGPSLSKLYKMHRQALEDHYRRHDDKFSNLEIAERSAVYNGEPFDTSIMDWLNKLRKQTRKT